MIPERPPGTLDRGEPDGVCLACGGLSDAVRQGLPCPLCGVDFADRRLGAVLDGRYKIEEVLGAGGMGRIYRATHLALGETVAVKFLLAHAAMNPEVRARFRREAQVLARLRHPGVVTVLDFGEHDGAPYLVMELLHGRTLETVVQFEAPVEVSRAVALLDPVLEVLEAVHAAGIAHRDLKPDNVMLVPGAMGVGERMKVLDFGIAAITDAPPAERLTHTGAVRGTPHYMSPEQCVGRNVGTPTDIYAMGAVLFELLTGTVPFMGTSAVEMMTQHMFVTPPTVASRRSGVAVPEGIEALIQRAMSKRQSERPTAAEFRVALARVLAGTDAATKTAAESAARAEAAGRSRSQRALAPVSVVPRAEDDPVGPGLAAPRVAAWGFSPARVDALRAALAFHGVETVAHMGDDLPPPIADARPWRALLVAAGSSAEARTRVLKADPLHGQTPVLILDVAVPADAPVLVRAGASDVALDRVDDAAICQKVLRAVRRGR